MDDRLTRDSASHVATFESLLTHIEATCRAVYAERLVSVVVFGSVGRGVPRPDSDIDVLLVVDGLPDGRMARVEEFVAVETALRPALARARACGVDTRLSPVIKSPAEARAGSPLFLDMVDDGRLLYDRHGAFAAVLDGLRARLATLGSVRVWRGSAWYWDLKPGFRPGEVIEL